MFDYRLMQPKCGCDTPPNVLEISILLLKKEISMLPLKKAHHEAGLGPLPTRVLNLFFSLEPQNF